MTGTVFALSAPVQRAAGWLDCNVQQSFSGPPRLTATSPKQPIQLPHSFVI